MAAFLNKMSLGTYGSAVDARKRVNVLNKAIEYAATLAEDADADADADADRPGWRFERECSGGVNQIWAFYPDEFIGVDHETMNAVIRKFSIAYRRSLRDSADAIT